MSKKRKKKIKNHKKNNVAIVKSFRKELFLKRLRQVSIVFAVLMCIALVVAGLLACQVETIYVEGNEHYSDEEIAEMVTEGRLGKNTIYLFFKYRNKEIETIPFIETMSVSIESVSSIRIKVYEKKLAGYVEYLGKYLYFDRDGYLVESSDVKTEGIPQVTGLSFDHYIMYEKLPLNLNANEAEQESSGGEISSVAHYATDEIFQEILDITQIALKYDLSVDKINFDQNNSIALTFDGVKVVIGDTSYIDEKMMVLPSILPKLADKEGVINMESYQKGDMIVFQPY